MTSVAIAPIASPEPAAAAPAGALCLGSWVELHEEPCRGGRRHHLLVNHRNGAVLGLNDSEARLCQRLRDGLVVCDDLVESDLIEELSNGGYFQDGAVADGDARGSGKQSFASTLDARWKGANRLVRWLHDRGGRGLFGRVAVTIQLVLGAAGCAALVVAARSHHKLHLRVHPAQIPLILAMSVVALAIHELGHALVVVHHGRTVDAVGVRLFLGTPAVYVESVDALLLTRKQRLIQAAAGPWAEWLVVSVAALWLCASPSGAGNALLFRFVILNAATIASNLLPFAGLDGGWILADAIREPDLAQRSRGAVCRLLQNALVTTANTADDWALAGYRALNCIVATLLIATSVFFWYQLFGNLADSLVSHGPIGWAALLLAGLVLGRPVANATVPRLRAAVDTVGALANHAHFRLQRKWRVAGIEALAGRVDELAGLSEAQLGVLAGHLHRTRVPRVRDIPAGNYTLTRRCTRGTVLISLDPAVVAKLT